VRVEIHGYTEMKIVRAVALGVLVAPSVPLYADFTYTATTRDYGRLDARPDEDGWGDAILALSMIVN
jgi:hypothetical protein